MIAKLLIAILLLVELYVIAYAGLMAYILNAWLKSDTFARRATELDWWLVAFQRVGMSLLLAVAVSAALFYINRLLVRRHYLIWASFPRYSALLTFSVITVAALAGAVSFLFNKPYL